METKNLSEKGIVIYGFLTSRKTSPNAESLSLPLDHTVPPLKNNFIQ